MKQVWKRFLAVALVGCALIVPALGEGTGNIAQRVQAPERVVLPAVTPGSHSTLAFEAEVYVPEVAKVPILQVKIDDIPEGTIFAAADALGLPDINRKASAWEEHDFANNGKLKSYSGYSSGLRQFYVNSNRGCGDQPEAVTHSRLYSNDFKKADYFLGQLEAAPYPDAEWEGTMTRDSACGLAQETIEAFTQGYEYTLEVDGALGGYAQLTDAEIYALNKGKKDPASVPKMPYAFSFHFAPVFEGIPITQYDNPWGWQSKADAEMWETEAARGHPRTVPNVVDSRIQVIVLDEGVHGLDWDNPLSVIGVLQEDTQLFPFGEILEKAQEELNKYCIASERDYDLYGCCYDIVVTEIRFGYACKQMEPGSMDLRLVPVWDFMVNGNLIRNGQWERLENNYGQAAVTLSAEDGSVMERYVKEVYQNNRE